MYGSKYDNLVKLKENGFQVAEFEIVSFENALTQQEMIKQIVQTNKDKSIQELSFLLKEYVDQYFNINIDIHLQCQNYAVRSSSNVEDGMENSFAGQFDTYLNVTKEELFTKIKECFLSLYNENVLSYVEEKHIPVDSLQMNVIIQRMVQPKYAGVIFTANPQGILNESVIVVGEGLGENIVLDKVRTTSYYYNLTDRVYYFEGEQDYLNKNQIEELIDVSQKVETFLGKGLDIEFGIENNTLYLMQARKITTIDDSHPLILDNSNIIESYPGISLPLTISFVKSIYSGVFEGVSRRILKNEKELAKHTNAFQHMVGSANGRLYYKISNWYTLLKFLPFHKKIIPVWQEMLGVRNKTYDHEDVKLSFGVRIMTYLNSLYELYSVPKNMEKLNQKFIQINNDFYQEFQDSLNEKDVLSLYNKIEKELFSCWDVTLLNDTYAFIYTGLLKKHLKKKYSNFEEKANEYIAGVSNIESMKPIKALITLSYEKDKLTKEKFDESVKEYIKNYGDRNLEELKLESETFRTNPDLLYHKIEEYREDMNRLSLVYENLHQNKKVATKEDKITKHLIQKCTLGIKNREISRLNRSRIFGMVRAMFLRWGEIFVDQGLIENKRDIFYLTVDEVKNLVYKKENMKGIIQKRKEEYKVFEVLPAYTRIIFSNNEFDKHHANVNLKSFYEDSCFLQGVPCSNGKVIGRALVIHQVSDAKDVKDKILITKMTDPGWVFLLATAKGVISEKGSLLSHTAIIARELKIPSIVGVNHLLSTIKTGDLIEMDGTTGTINILEKEK